MDDDILKTVESMLGPNVRIVDCEKVSSVREEEVLLINGVPIQLDGEDGEAIRSALLTGTVPPCDLLNQLLFRAGIVRHPVRLDTSLSVTSTLVTREEVTVARDGRVLDERSTETKEDNCYSSSCSEIWEPVRIIPMADVVEARERGVPLNRMATTSSMPDNPIVTSPTPSEDPPLSSFRSSSNDSIGPAHIISCTSKSSSVGQVLSTSASSASTTSTSGASDSLATSSSLPSDNSSATATTHNAHPPRRTGAGHNALSCDSGHEDLYSSSVMDATNAVHVAPVATTPSLNSVAGVARRTPRLSRTPSSMSSCFELLSSIEADDEPDFIRRSGLSDEELSEGVDLGYDGVYLHSPAPPGSPVFAAAPPQQSMPSIFGETSGKDGAVGHRRHGSCASATGDGQQLDNADDNSLIYRDGALISGSLDSLIQHMVPTADYYPDKSYLFAFLLSARLFVRPHQLLDKVCRLCDVQQQLGLDMSASDAAVLPLTPPPTAATSQQPPPLLLKQQPPPSSTANSTSSSSSTSAPSPFPISADSQRRFAANFVRLLADWIETFPYDFRDERLMLHVRRMTQKCIQLDPSRRRDISTMLQSLLHRLTLLDQYEEYLGRVQCGADVAANCSTSAAASTTGSNTGALPDDLHHQLHTHHASPYPQVVDFTEVCTSATQLAHQLTHIELERLSHIGPEEFVQAFAKEQQHCPQAATGFASPDGGSAAQTKPTERRRSGATATSPTMGDVKKTRNLESYVAWFNRLSYLVASEIVKHPKKKQRVRVIEYWIETARECFNIGNFNSLMAIIAGLNMSPISRLKKTWAKAQSAKFMVLEHQMDPTSNFHSYRSTLKAAMWRSAGATDERQRIVIPFFSLLVKDLYFLNEGCSNKLPNGHINFDKFWQLAKQVQEFIGWKQVQCTFERQSRITWMLQTAAVLAESSLALASFECEQADSAAEKDRYKALKTEIASMSSSSVGSSVQPSSAGPTTATGGGHSSSSDR